METFVVSDTDIFMDLIKAGLLGEFFHLPFEIHTTDLVVFQLKDKPQLSVIQTFIDSKWLHIKTLTSKEMTRLAIMKNNALKNYDATIQDCSAWLYAKENAFSILASDGRSRIIAETLGVKALDIRFILDKMVEHKIINYATAKNKIAKLSHTIDRLSTKKFSKGFILGKPNQKRRIMKT